ncbi:hypothetical protein SAMD00023353_8200200 [Rosellinia necatrix]|uniref:Uncharacterized protein n=1 Tax=Rosellinia necatrix TaxID=77044 RepID=A0A1S8AB91_ROSNE|nr:hypothetical protein SAMD00023353_8200200 [Rosellinia necatrix]
MRGSTNCNTSLLDLPVNADVIPRNSLRGGLKLSMGSNAHINRRNRGTASILRRRGNVVKKGPAITMDPALVHPRLEACLLPTGFGAASHGAEWGFAELREGSETVESPDSQGAMPSFERGTTV